MRKALLLLVVLAGFLAGCENKYKDPDPQAMGYEYFPLEIGDYRIYDVTDIKIRNNEGDTSRFQMRERVDTNFYDQTNQLVYKIVRSIRLRENSAWIDDSVMVAAKLDNMVLLTKNNTKFVKLVFPVKEGVKWEADAFNHPPLDPNQTAVKPKESSRYEQIDAAFEVNGQSFPMTVTVIQGNPMDNKQVLDNRKEVYAQGIGLVHRVFNRAVYSPCFPDQCEKGPDFKLEGHERHEVLVSHGKM